MIACAYCHSSIHDASRYCSVCGKPNFPAARVPSIQGRGVIESPLNNHPAASHGHFGQMFGLDPRVTLLTLVVDTMLFGGSLATLGASTLLSVPAGIALGFITYKAQRHWYRDDRESAVIKGLIVGLLTAIPTSLPGFLTIPSGIVGLVHLLPRRRRGGFLV
jgi:hypothetical protein